jgi:hypothetical protein
VLHRSRLHATPRTASRSPCHAKDGLALSMPRLTSPHLAKSKVTRWRYMTPVPRSTSTTTSYSVWARPSLGSAKRHVKCQIGMNCKTYLYANS